jgi:creatine kinase
MKAEAVVGSLIRGCRKLVELEMEPKSEEDIAELGPPGTATTAPGTGSSPDIMDEFPRDRCPTQMPDVSSRHSLAADVLKADPVIYQQVKDRCTSKGVPFATCIKACFDNFGHPFVKTLGAVAGDADSYAVFKEFFDPLIRLRHPGYSPNSSHVSCSDWAQMCCDPIDPSGQRVLRAQVKAARNLQELRFLPACSLDERRAVESAAVQALLAMTQNFKGDYFPLYGSESYPPKHGGMTEADEARLREAGLACDEPDSSVLISSGLAQDWPDARGIFVDECSKLSVVINELDHLSFSYTEQDGQANLQLAFENLCKVLRMFEESLATAGWHFAKDEKLGFLGTCPSMLGTCLTASVTIRIPLLSGQPRFRELCKRLDLEASLGAGFQEGVWEVQNSTRLGSSDVDQVNSVIKACRELLNLEALLEAGKDVDLDATPIQN